MRKKYIEKNGWSVISENGKKCLNPDSNRDPPAYAADCSVYFFPISINLYLLWLP